MASAITSTPITTKLVVAARDRMPSTHGEITSHAPSATLIHSSHGRNTDKVTTSTRMIRNPTITALRVGTRSRSNSSAQGEMHSQMPKAQLAQSSHCFGSDSSARTGMTEPYGGPEFVMSRNGPPYVRHVLRQARSQASLSLRQSLT